MLNGPLPLWRRTVICSPEGPRHSRPHPTHALPCCVPLSRCRRPCPRVRGESADAPCTTPAIQNGPECHWRHSGPFSGEPISGFEPLTCSLRELSSGAHSRPNRPNLARIAGRPAAFPQPNAAKRSFLFHPCPTRLPVARLRTWLPPFRISRRPIMALSLASHTPRTMTWA